MARNNFSSTERGIEPYAADPLSWILSRRLRLHGAQIHLQRDRDVCMSMYRIENRIGAGGMGAVYRAIRTVANGDEHEVACKMMHRARIDTRNGIRRFHNEARLMMTLQHAHVVRMIDYVTDGDGVLYLIMELVPGASVAELFDAPDHERRSYDTVRAIAADTLDALCYLHDHGVLHRDISPGNLLVCPDGSIKVADFGVAKTLAENADHSADHVGKLAYLAPEVCEGAALDPRSDLFAFAATMYELLTGEPPFGRHMPAVAIRRLEGTIAPLPDTVPDDLRTLVMRLLACDPDERQPATARVARERLTMPADRAEIVAELGALARRRYETKRLSAAAAPRAIRDARRLVERVANTDSGRQRQLPDQLPDQLPASRSLYQASSCRPPGG